MRVTTAYEAANKVMQGKTVAMVDVDGGACKIIFEDHMFVIFYISDNYDGYGINPVLAITWGRNEDRTSNPS